MDGTDEVLVLAEVTRGGPEDVLEGILHCPAARCRQEYPILDGIPLIVPRVRAYVQDNLPHLLSRSDITPLLEGLIGDCCGPGSALDATRQYLSSYGVGHYDDLDPETPSSGAGSVLDLLERGLELAEPLLPGPTLDVGCAVGRPAFELAARQQGLVLGVDLNFAMLRVASRALREGIASYPRRRVGLVYDRREVPIDRPGAKRLDFWACDALALPFADDTFALTTSLNVLDCVADPRQHLSTLGRVLKPGGKVILSSPYDWSPGATPVESWLGGHSQRGGEGGSSEALLRALLSPGAHEASIPTLRLFAEAEALPWTVRIHDRYSASYSVHLVVAEALQDPDGPQSG
ncbi:MAG: methyltransferase domain-containing protein [Planctomycetes bacterium]|nr:methyltransferase domain-containing protein [Planctomycetota bacterium]